MLHSNISGPSLSIHVSSATELVSASSFGKQNVYLRFSLDYNEKNTFLKTFTHKDAGENATWNQTFTISLNNEPDIFVEVLDDEAGFDKVIGFAAIPINQVINSPGANMNGLFDIYTTKSERAGLLNLQLAGLGFQNSQQPNFNGAPVRGQSYVNTGHCERLKSSKTKHTAVNAGGAILGGALAIGAGILGKKLYDTHEAKEEQEQEQERQRQEEDTRRHEEDTRRQEEDTHRRDDDEKRAREREEFNRERQNYETEKSEFEKQKKHEEENSEHEHRQRRHDDEEGEGRCGGKHCNRNDCEGRQCHRKACEGDDCHNKNCENKHCHNKKKDCERSRNDCSDDDDSARKWNPVGTYSAGDRVKYHHQVYICIQGHTSNPTWQPDAAHSLWQTE